MCAPAGECSHHSAFTPSILENVRWVQVTGETGNQTSLLQLCFQIDEKQTLLPAVSSQFLDMSGNCSRQHPFLDNVPCPSLSPPHSGSRAFLLSTVPKDICASHGLPLSEHSCPRHPSYFQSQHDLDPSSHGTEGTFSIPQ